MANTELRRALRRIDLASAAHAIGRFAYPMRVTCPSCSTPLAPGWDHEWRCASCGKEGDVIDYLRAHGMSFTQAQQLVLANVDRWVSWGRRALREALPLTSVLGELEVSLHGNTIRCLVAENHRRGDLRPSCTVYADAVHCFACGFHADAIAVWRMVRGCDYPTARRELLILAQQGRDSVAVQVPDRVPARNGLDFVPLFDDVLACCPPLPVTTGGQYLRSRGIDVEAAHELGVRWLSNVSLGRIHRLLDRLPSGTGADAGLLDSHGRFTLRCHRLVIPARAGGGIVWMQGRSTRPDVPKPRRWRSLPSIRPYPVGLDLLDAAPLSRPVFLAEGMTDWMALATHGYLSLAWPGAYAPLRQWLRLLSGREIVLAFDPDEAGDRGAIQLRADLKTVGIVPLRVPLPAGVDVCEFLHRASAAGQAARLPDPVSVPDS
ncbi:DNA primase [Crossiella equi]|uniref:DNA primase n=1 Tax=Crossiella equi TaxID=130796 RepID=A0ABS5AMF7_9PSEU|nr:toprim domain-containing protein [Crossiella equi]MBP2477591.1 DNA primase [Crossiella equi]